MHKQNAWLTVYMPNTYIMCYSRICEVSDLFIVGDLVLLSLANTQMNWSQVP